MPERGRSFGKVTAAKNAAVGRNRGRVITAPPTPYTQNPPGTPPRTLPGQLVPPGGGSVAQAISGRSNAEVAKTQQFLRNRGYNIRVDGIMGPSTSSALNDFQMGGGSRNAQKWTQLNRPYDDGVPDTPRGSNNNHGVERRGNSTTVKDKGVKVQSAKTTLAQQQAAEKSSGLAKFGWGAAGTYAKGKKGKGSLPAGSTQNTGGEGSVYDKFDPDVLARASVEAKYGPQIAELLRQEKVAGLAGDYRVGEIGEMYGKYVGDIKNRNIQSAESRDGMVAATGDLAASIAGGVALGEDEVRSLNQTGAIDTTYATQMAQSGTEYDNRMASAAQGGGVFAAQQAQGVKAANIAGIQNERKDLLAQQGADLVATRQAAQQWQQEMQQRDYQFEVGAQSDRTKNNIAIAQLRAANAMLPVEKRMKALELEKMIAEIGYTNAQTAKANRPDPVDPADAPFPSQFIKLSKPQRNDLQSTILDSIPEGATTPRIVEVINARLRAMGYKPIDNKQVGEFAYNTAKAAGARGVSRKYWKL